MNIATLSSKFQIIIPKKIREQMKLKAGQTLMVTSKGNCIQLLQQENAKGANDLKKSKS